MHSIPSSLLQSPRFEENSLKHHRGYTSTREINQINLSTQANAEISINTAEGDTVTLSASALYEMAYTSYDQRGRLRGQPMDIQAERLQMNAEKDFVIVVEGDLSTEELADIQQVLSTIKNLATHFFTGNGKKVEVLTHSLLTEDFETIASLEASLDYSHSMTVAQLATVETGKKDISSQIPEIDSMKKLIDDITKTIEGSKVHKGKIGSVMSKAIPQLLQKLADQHQADEVKRKGMEQVTEQLFNPFESSAKIE